MVDGCRVNCLTLCQELRRAVFLSRYCSSSTSRSFFYILENKLMSCADDSTLLSVVPSPGVRVNVAESLNRDHGKVSEWCNLSGMKFNASKTIIIIIIIKKDWQCKAGRERLTPYQSEDPSPTLPTYRGKEEKGKIVEEKKERATRPTKRHWTCS